MRLISKHPKIKWVMFLYIAPVCLLTPFIIMGYWLHSEDMLNLTEDKIESILSYTPEDNTIVFDNKGEKIGEFFSQYRIWIPYESIPRAMIESVIAIEDQNFFAHPGIDLKAIVRASLAWVKNQKIKQGGSTITQQLVRHFLLSRNKTMKRKIKEAILSLYLETKISKKKILELYLNTMFLGHGSYGIGAAAERYFGRNIQQLKPNEMALIAGLFQSPSAYNPYRYPKKAKKRQKQIIIALLHQKKISKKMAKKLYKSPLRYEEYTSLNQSTAPYFIDYIREETQKKLNGSIKGQGLRIYTTLDSRLQKIAEKSILKNEEKISKAEKNLINSTKKKTRNPLEVAQLVTTAETGEIVAMIGGRNYQVSQFNRAANSQRAVGSAFKPIVYSLALNRDRKWSDVMYITPIAVDDFKPRNYGSHYLSETTIMQALYMSINTTAVELGKQLGIESVIEHSAMLGNRSNIKKEAGIYLGSAEMNLLDLARTYGTFANKGVRTELIAIRKITDRNGKILYESPDIKNRQETVMSQEANWLITHGLQSVLRYGTAISYKNLADWSAGKTGTTNESKDNWFCGYSDKLVSIVWVGTDQSLGLNGNATGTSLALPIWGDFMKEARKIYPGKNFSPATGTEMAKIHPKYGFIHKHGIPMYFLKGQAPKKINSDLELISRSGSFRKIFE